MSHTSYSPSGYDQWSVCTASVPAIEADKKTGVIATDGGSEYAREGTIAHALLAICLDLDISPRDFIGEEIPVDDLDGEMCPVDAEMGEEVDRAYDYIRDFITPGARVWVEKKLSLDKVLPGQKGTGDVIIFPRDGERLHVFDLKYGKGKFVFVVDNSQMKLYGIGAFDHKLTRQERTKLKDVMLHVVQPRMNNIESWVLPKPELERFRVEAFSRYQEAQDPSRRKFVAGEHCWFCDRRAVCAHLKESIFSWIIDDPESGAFDAFKSVEALTNEQLAELHPMLSFIGAWANNTRKYMEEQALKGTYYPGLKLVEGKKSARAWKDEKAAERYLINKELDEDQRYKKTLVTPAQAEKVIGRKKLDDDFKKLVSQTDGKPSLAADDDPRKAYDQALADEFDDD